MGDFLAAMRSRFGRSRTFSSILMVVLVAASLPLFSINISSAAVTETVGPNVNVTAVAGNQAEATIAVDPNNPQRMYAASNPGTTGAYSTDGGATWTPSSIANTCCDNVATFDQFGNLFLVNINSGLNRIDLYLSTDGGQNFGVPTQIDSGSIDQPTVAVGAGSVWVTWNRSGTIYASGAQVTALGVVGAFSAPQAAPSAAAVGGSFGDIAIGPTGQVMVTYQSSTALYVNTDPDGLGPNPFGAQVFVTNMNVTYFDYITPQSGRSIDSEVGLAWDTQGANSGRIYMIYTDEIPDGSDDTDIFLRFSDNDGATWSAALRVNDDATVTSQFLPHIDIDQATGYIGVTWHDARNDPVNNNLTQLWGAFSIDAGASFRPNFQISAGASNDDTANNGVDYGDYRWSDFVDGVLYPVWADNSNSTGDNPDIANNTFDIYMAAVTLSVVGPEITSVTNNGPIDEGQSATISVAATHPLNETLSYEFDCDNNLVYEIGPQAASTTSCAFGDNGNFTVNVQVTDQSGNTATGSTVVVVNNLPPIINQITTSAVAATITTTVDAVDPANPALFPFTGDTLSYSFDCNNDLIYEIGPQIPNAGDCVFGVPGQYTINVLVEDGDGGSTPGSVTVTISKLCVSNYTGAVRTLTPCASSEQTIWLPQQAPITLCASNYTGAARVSSTGSCNGAERTIVVLGDGSVEVCVSKYTSRVRVPSLPGTCNASETTTHF
jgi:BNR/Asp-box repeat